MKIDLQPAEPLSEVVFVHDYLQLIFQDCTFTVFNTVTYSTSTDELRQDQPGFCDSLVALIDQTARVEVLDDRLLLHFSGGAVVSVPVSGSDARGPEAWQFNQLGGPTVVKQNS